MRTFVTEVVLFVFGVLVDLYLAWQAMLWLGVAHGSFDERVPPLGYWTCFFLLWALQAPVHAVLFVHRLRNELEARP